MELGQQLALTYPWWMWQEKVIADAVATVKLRHWLAIVKKRLAANKAAGLSPSSMQELSHEIHLHRDPRNINRLQAGKYSLTDQHIVGLSVIFNVRVCELLPDAADWLEQVIKILCGSAVGVMEARALAIYRVEQGAVQPTQAVRELSGSALRRTRARLNGQCRTPDDVFATVTRAAIQLGKILMRFPGGWK